MSNNILVIDDERDFLESVRRGLITAGFKGVRIESDPIRAAELFRGEDRFDLALIDITMPGMSGIELLEFIRAQSPHTECIMVTALNEARMAVESIRKGAYEYLVKPVSRDDLIQAVDRALERKRFLDILHLSKRNVPPGLEHKEAFLPIITQSKKLIRVLKEAELHAPSNVPVLITGESGTGKELLARAIHLASPRASRVFTAVNMASLTGTLFEAEFFGHTRGSFTGADRERSGYIEQTNNGTLFLDEIGVLPPEMQGKLHRVLQEGEYLKLGSSQPRKADIRFVAATNEDLEQLMAAGRFRKDLYYRLKGAWLHLPPLRERKEDIPLLVDAFLGELAGDPEKVHVEDDAMSMLMTYDYPGNIRELRSILHSALNLAQGGSIRPGLLPENVRKRKVQAKDSFQDGSPRMKPLADVERDHILRAYQVAGRNKSRTAKLLGIGLNTLRRKLESYGE
ncbi:MAG: sigma-54-dependent Fis family transcriptional regulator [Deltaproteobacteria bacterium]|nr:sigma-54-dependent Fis family transcriptional regulator [Deltaproteobacteria bacterium]